MACCARTSDDPDLPAPDRWQAPVPCRERDTARWATNSSSSISPRHRVRRSGRQTGLVVVFSVLVALRFRIRRPVLVVVSGAAARTGSSCALAMFQELWRGTLAPTFVAT